MENIFHEKGSAPHIIHSFLVNADLMREPVLQDKRQEHLKFCKYANELIEMISGKTQSSNIDASLEKIRRVSSYDWNFLKSFVFIKN